MLGSLEAEGFQAGLLLPKHEVLARDSLNKETDGRILTAPPERRIHPAAPVPLARLPDESGVPVAVATCLGGTEMRRKLARFIGGT